MFSVLFLTTVVTFSCVSPFIGADRGVSNRIFELRVLTGSSDRRSRTLGLGIEGTILTYKRPLFGGYGDLNRTIRVNERGARLFGGTTRGYIDSGNCSCLIGIYISGRCFGAQGCGRVAVPNNVCGTLGVRVKRTGKRG